MQSSTRPVVSVRLRSTWESCACSKPVSFQWDIPVLLLNSWPTMRHRKRRQFTQHSACRSARCSSVLGSIIRRRQSIPGKRRVREVPFARMAHVELSQLPGPKNWAIAGGSNGYRAALVRRQLTPGLISSLPRAAGLPPFISFSTNYPDLDSAVRRPMLRIGKRREEYFAVAQAALLEAKHRKSIGNPGEKRLSP